MKVFHFLCKPEGLGMTGLKHQGGTTYRSDAWAISESHARELVGGGIYFHESKAKPSRIGGRIIGYEVVTLDPSESVARTDRIAFTFDSQAEYKNAAWRGPDHGMSMSSGVIEV